MAKWRDIVSGTDGFDVYRFQMLVFSLVVGLALLQVGFTDLSSFEIPPALLGVLGLSQAIYIGGKLTEAPSMQDLDKALDTLIAAETSFADAAVKLGISPPTIPQTEPTAAVSAMPEYREFAAQRDRVVTMFESLFGKLETKPNRDRPSQNHATSRRTTNLIRAGGPSRTWGLGSQAARRRRAQRSAMA